MKFFEFRQNNSHGKFFGPNFVFVQAPNAQEANRLAELNGVHFAGGCKCCGPRWSPVNEENAHESVPLRRGAVKTVMQS